MISYLCKTFENWQLAQTFSSKWHWYFCVKSEPLFTAAMAQQAKFHLTQQNHAYLITFQAAWFQNLFAKSNSLTFQCFYYFTLRMLNSLNNVERRKTLFLPAPSPLLSEGLAAASLLGARTIACGPGPGCITRCGSTWQAASWPAAGEGLKGALSSADH